MAKTRPQTVPARRPPTPDPKDVVCPHQHFKYDIIDRDILSRKQHLNMLSTPKGYRWIMMKGDAADETIDQDDVMVQPCKVVKKKPGKTYVHNILAELWSLLTPEMVARLKEMLMSEFGLTEEAAVDFICHSRQDTIQTAQRKLKKRGDGQELEEEDKPPDNLALPRLIVEPKLCDKSQFAVGIDPCYIREFSRIVSSKFSEYVVAMMCARRNNRHRRMAEVVLNGLCNLTGEKTTLDNPKNRLHKILTVTSDRIALWLAQNMDDDDSKRDKRRRQEDNALKKKKHEKKKEQERKRKEKDKMNKELERNRKRKDRDDAGAEKQKNAEQEKKNAEKDKRRQEIEKFREDDKKKKQEEQKKAKEDEEKKNQDKKDRQEKSKQRSAEVRPASAKPTAKEDQKAGRKGSASKPTTRDQKPGQNQPQQARTQQEPVRKTEKGPSVKKSEPETKSGQGNGERGSQEGGKSSEEPRPGSPANAGAEEGVSEDQTGPGQAGTRAGTLAQETAEGEDQAAGGGAKPEEGTLEDQPGSQGPDASASQDDGSPGMVQGGTTSGDEGVTLPGAQPETPKPLTGASEVETQRGLVTPQEPQEQTPGAPGSGVTGVGGQDEVTIDGQWDQQPAEQSGQQPAKQPGQQPAEQLGQQPAEQSGQQPGGQPTTTDSRTSAEDRVITVTASQIGDTEPISTPRQETLQDILNKELEKRIEPKDEETAEIIRAISAKTATWIDQNVKDAEIEYGSRDQLTQITPVSQKPKGPLFSVRKIDPIRHTYDVRLATHNEAGQKIRALRRKASGHKSSAPNDPSDPKMWAKWAVNASQMADDWGHWIDKTIQDAEDKAVLYQTKTKEGITDPRDEDDWNRFVEVTTKNALSWRRKKKSLDEAAKSWKVTTQ